jgi:20S proteasome subunit alpha 7
VKPFTKLQKCTSIRGHVADDSIYLTHGESTKDKEFELEMSWISTTDTNNLHQPVPKDLLDDAETQAKKEDEDEEMGDAE